LAEQFGTTDAQMLRVLRKLEDGKLVKEFGGEWTGFLPACDPDRITVEEVMQQIEGSQRLIPELGPEDRERTVIAELFDRLGAATTTALSRQTIGQLARELYAPRVTRAEDRRTT